MSRPFKSIPMLLAAAAILNSVTARADTPGCTATGVIPAALPAHLMIGIGANQNDTWARQSGTKWDVQWMYLSGQAGNNWYNGFTYSPADGSWIDALFTTISGYGFIPGIHLYNMGYGQDGSPGHDPAGILTEIQQSAWVKEYFTEFKVLMQKAKNFGKPIVIVLEGDSFGFLENLTNNDPTVMAAVASTGLPGVGKPAEHRRWLRNGLSGNAQERGRIQRILGPRHSLLRGPRRYLQLRPH